MRNDDRVRITHMIEAAERALRFVAGQSRDALDQDDMLCFALVRAIEIIVEAASKVSPATRSATPQIPWPAIISMRNRLVHAYFDINTAILWQTTTTELPLLLAMLRPMVAAAAGEPQE